MAIFTLISSCSNRTEEACKSLSHQNRSGAMEFRTGDKTVLIQQRQALAGEVLKSN